MAVRMTKAMRKDNERIEAWREGREFKENARAKPAVPELDVEDVLRAWTPPDVTGAGQFFTPLEAAYELWSYGYPGNLSEGARILDPCAGIGHLIYAMQHEWWWKDGSVHVDTYELEGECVALGERLFPDVSWFHSIPFDELDAITGAYDLVVMNPPFGTTRGMYGGRDDMCGGKVSRSEHVFLWLAALALKEDGKALVVGPYNMWDKVPKTAVDWFEDRLTLEHSWGPLPGEFRHSKSMSVHGFIFRRTGYDVPETFDKVTVTENGIILVDEAEFVERCCDVGCVRQGGVFWQVHEDGLSKLSGNVAARARAFVEVDDIGWHVAPVAVSEPGELITDDEGRPLRWDTRIVGYIPVVKRGKFTHYHALGTNHTPYLSDEIMRPTPEEAMVLYGTGMPLYQNQSSMGTSFPWSLVRTLTDEQRGASPANTSTQGGGATHPLG